MAAPSHPPVIIVGAGITGLVLAQALKKHNVPFVVYERDPDAMHRDLLPEQVSDALPTAYVDGEATRNGENGNFLFFNLRTGEALWRVPPAKRIRMAREKFRRLLMDGIPIQWNHAFVGFEPCSDGSGLVKANFTSPDGPRTVEGSLVVGCDGSRSVVRKSLFPNPELHTNYQLPVRLLGASVVYPGTIASQPRKLDPFFFQGGDPETDASHWFSFLDSPDSSGRGDDSRDCQILVSWPYREGFLGLQKPLEVPDAGHDRVAQMKRISKDWADPFHTIIHSMPPDADVKAISLEDWVPPQDGWHSVPGSDRVVLVGDAAHAMTMYRGEAANHGIMDVSVLLSQLLPVLEGPSEDPSGSDSLKQAVDSYTHAMQERAAPAVLNSRQACLDAHVYSRVNDSSPLIMKRIAVQDK